MMKYISVGTQAGLFDGRLIASFIIDFLEKCHEIRGEFVKCDEELKRGRLDLEAKQKIIEKMETTVSDFAGTMDSMGTRILHCNMSIVHKNTQIEKLRKEIEAKKALLAKHEVPGCTTESDRDQAASATSSRDRLELQLQRVRRDIDNTYEDIFEAEEKLYSLKDLRLIRRDEERRLLEAIKAKAADADTKKRDILTISEGGTFDMSGMYVSPTEYKNLETELEGLKHKQCQVERHIEMQQEERVFLQDTTYDIAKRVYDLEKKVRKENGDHSLEGSMPTKEPEWFHDLSAPSIWYGSPRLSSEQLKRLFQRQCRPQSRQQPSCFLNGDDRNSDDTELSAQERVIRDIGATAV